MRDTPLPAVFSVNEFVIWSRLSRTKAYAMMASGKLPFFKIGGRRYIRRDDAQVWLDAMIEAYRAQFIGVDCAPLTSISI